jgi:hypothetical protein
VATTPSGIAIVGKMPVKKLEVDHLLDLNDNDNQLAWALIGCREETYAFLGRYENKQCLEHIRVASFDPVKVVERETVEPIVMKERLEILSNNFLQPMYAQSIPVESKVQTLPKETD